MNDPAGLQIDMLKPHLQVIFDEARRVGPEGCRAARYEVEARFREETRKATSADAVPDCGASHLLAAVAMQIYLDVQFEDGALDALLGAISAQWAADDCDAAAAKAAALGKDG